MDKQRGILLIDYVLWRYRNKDSGVEGFPLRSWSIEVYLINDHGEQVSANVFDKVTYRLHPSFGDRATQGSFPVYFHYSDLVCSGSVCAMSEDDTSVSCLLYGYNGS
jgi:hypothetical protein